MAVKNNWEHLAGCDWAQLLQFQPRFAGKCDWSKLDGGDWISLIAARPEFIDRCDWSKFKAHDIVRIVRQCGKIGVPMAAFHLDGCDFSQLSASDWSQVLMLRPDLVDKFESIERDWSKDDASDDVEEILQDSP